MLGHLLTLSTYFEQWKIKINASKTPRLNSMVQGGEIPRSYPRQAAHFCQSHRQVYRKIGEGFPHTHFLTESRATQ
jgi:hypothetical protein